MSTGSVSPNSPSPKYTPAGPANIVTINGVAYEIQSVWVTKNGKRQKVTPDAKQLNELAIKINDYFKTYQDAKLGQLPDNIAINFTIDDENASNWFGKSNEMPHIHSLSYKKDDKVIDINFDPSSHDDAIQMQLQVSAQAISKAAKRIFESKSKSTPPAPQPLKRRKTKQNQAIQTIAGNGDCAAASLAASIPEQTIQDLRDLAANRIATNLEFRDGPALAAVKEALTAEGRPTTGTPEELCQALAAHIRAQGAWLGALFFYAISQELNCKIAILQQKDDGSFYTSTTFGADDGNPTYYVVYNGIDHYDAIQEGFRAQLPTSLQQGPTRVDQFKAKLDEIRNLSEQAFAALQPAVLNYFCSELAYLSRAAASENNALIQTFITRNNIRSAKDAVNRRQALDLSMFP